MKYVFISRRVESCCTCVREIEWRPGEILRENEIRHVITVEFYPVVIERGRERQTDRREGTFLSLSAEIYVKDEAKIHVLPKTRRTGSTRRGKKNKKKLRLREEVLKRKLVAAHIYRFIVVKAQLSKEHQTVNL